MLYTCINSIQFANTAEVENIDIFYVRANTYYQAITNAISILVTSILVFSIDIGLPLSMLKLAFTFPF